MKLLKFLFFVFIVIYVSGQVIANNNNKEQPDKPFVVNVVTIKGLFGSPEQVWINSYVTKDSRFLYSLWRACNGNGEMFIESLMKEGKSLEECINILENNENALNEAQKKIDKDFYASLKLSDGLIAGAMTFGGLFGAIKSQKMLQDMYWRKQSSKNEIVDLFIAKIEEKQPGYFKSDVFPSDESYQEYMASLKRIDIPESYGKEERDKIEQKYNIIGTKGLNEYIRYAGAATVGFASLYGFGFPNLKNYVQNVYNLYQRKKLEREQLILKDMVQNKKMLEVLRSARGLIAG